MRGLLILAGLALVAAAPPKKPAPARPVAADWSRTSVRLPSGNFRLGNPQAKVKLVEYLSLTCPHCGHMSETAIPPLVRDYVRTGKVSYEVRPATRDPVDVVAMSLARCAGAARFFPLLHDLYAQQATWVEKGYQWLQTAPSPEGKSNAEVLKLVAAGSGLDNYFAAHGIPAARQAACFAGPEPQFISKAAAAFWKPDAGTPTFEINGTIQGTLGSWDELKAKLVAAGA